MRLLVLAAGYLLNGAAGIDIRDGCGPDSALLARVPETTPMEILHGVIGETRACYAVSAQAAGAGIRGYIVDSAAPKVQEFERRRALESRIIVPAPPEPLPAPMPVNRREIAPEVVAAGPMFHKLAGMDFAGKRIKIPGEATIALVIFWNSESAPARRTARELMNVESRFKSKGVQAYGVVAAESREQAESRLDDMGLDYPQLFDRQHIAAKYHADPKRGTILVIDASSQIVLASSSLSQIRTTLETLLSTVEMAGTAH